jgi:hypothetical protein
MDFVLPFMGSSFDRRKHRKEFLALLLKAVEDGKLTQKEMDELHDKKEEYDLTEEDIRPLRVQVYVRAYHVVSDDEKVLEEEWNDMLKIQKFLGISDSEISRTKRDLLRLHILQEIKQNNLPIVPVPDLALTKGEKVHWVEQGAVSTQENKKKSFTHNRIKLIVTSKRMVLRGTDAVSEIRFSRIAGIKHKTNVIRIMQSNGDVWEIMLSANADIVRALLRILVMKHGSST